jgi:hypothetical protein
MCIRRNARSVQSIIQMGNGICSILPKHANLLGVKTSTAVDEVPFKAKILKHFDAIISRLL